MGYTSVVGRTTTEKTIEKSRFITYVAHVEGEEDARSFLGEVRSLHPLATHVCWAYIADKVGNEQRFSDDGEPQGTAGMPILGVLKAQKLFEVAVAVVRYFGGIKLGAGGLVRAYSSSAAEGVAASGKRTFDVCIEFKVCVDYPQIDGALRFFSSAGYEVLSSEYGARAEYAVPVKESEAKDFKSKLVDRLNGKADVSENGRYYYPFPLDNPD